MGWFYENAVAPGFRMDPVAVTEFLRTYCKPNVLHSGFEIYRAEPADVADNVPLADNKLTLPVLYMDLTVARLGTLPDNADARQALVAPIHAMVAGRINVQLVPGAGHFVADENPDFVSAQLTSFVAANSPR
jgi:hypothetical protein